MPFITQGKTNLKYILIVVALAAIVGGGVFGYQYLYPTESPPIQPVIRPSADETANWEIYKNEEHKFEIKYPESWHAYEDVRLGLAAISTFSQEQYDKYFETVDEEKIGENYGFIHINYIEGIPLDDIFLSAKMIIEKTSDLPDSPLKIEEFATQELNIGGSRGYGLYYRVIYLGQTYYEEGVFGIYLIEDQDGQGVIGLEGKFIGKTKDKEIYQGYAKNYRLMISTFQFLE